jgi:acetylornithine deacetylase/succinyl-diaminopimelate desuccinylase-like protein
VTLASVPTARATSEALGVIGLLASEIGSRRPCSPAERRAGEALASWLRAHGLDPQLEEHRGYSTFAAPYGLLFGTALAGGLLQARAQRAGAAVAAIASALAALEGDLRVTPVSDLLSRRPTANLVGSIAPTGAPRQRVCLVGHMDSTRYGLLFHPRAVRHLGLLTAIPAASALVLAAGPLLRRLPGEARAVRRAALAGLAFSLIMLAEREIRGDDVPGASDNASGTAVAMQLAAECAARPLGGTTVDLLITTCEESGLLGAQAYARGPRERIDGTLFVNFDTVGGDVPLTYIRREGSTVPRSASPRLVAHLERIAAERPELGLRAAHGTPGLPTDATVMMARGEEAVTLLAQGDSVPHYHQTTDTYENVHPPTIERTLETGRELLTRLDREVSAAT